MKETITSVTLFGYTDDETLTFVMREEGIVLIHFDNTERINPPTFSNAQIGISMEGIIAEAKKLGWNTVGGPSVRLESEPEVKSELLLEVFKPKRIVTVRVCRKRQSNLIKEPLVYSETRGCWVESKQRFTNKRTLTSEALMEMLGAL